MTGGRPRSPPPRSSSGTVLRRRRRQPQLFFCPRGVFERLLGSRLPASSCRAAVAARAPGSARPGNPTPARPLRRSGGRQRPLGHQPAPREELVRGNAMLASHQAYRHARLERLLDDPNLLRRCPAPTALNRCDDLNSIRRVGHRHGCVPRTCQVGDRVRSVRGYLSQPLPDFSPEGCRQISPTSATGCRRARKKPPRHDQLPQVFFRMRAAILLKTGLQPWPTTIKLGSQMNH